MGFFDGWRVSGITTDAARVSEPFYILGCRCFLTSSPRRDLGSSEEARSSAGRFIELHRDFESYFYRGNRERKDGATRFLVALASFYLPEAGMEWDWKLVRHHSQGLYGSMVETPDEFRKFNVPIVDKAVGRIRDVFSVV
jgi:hypothetical protein